MHAKKTNKPHVAYDLLDSKRLIMVCVRQENSNTTFTILSYLVASVDVLTTIVNVRYMADSRFLFSAVTQSLWNSHFLFSLCFDLTQPRTVDLRLPQVTDVRLYVTQLSIGTFTATLHLRHVERSVFHLTVQDSWLLKLDCWKCSFTEVLRN